MLRIDFQSPPPKVVFLDLDNTLWDFDGNAEEALAELFHRHHLHIKSNFNVAQFIDLYKEINASWWRRYEKGEVNKDQLRTRRFYDTLIQMGIPESEHPENVWDEYLAICPIMTRLMPGCMSFLESVSAFVPLVLITNGFQETQTTKIQHSGIHKYVSKLLTSEAAGVAKPDKQIFQTAAGLAGIQENEGLYIGDTWHTDVKGGTDAGLPSIWYNHQRLDLPETPLDNPTLYLGSVHSLLELEAALIRWFQMTN